MDQAAQFLYKSNMKQPLENASILNFNLFGEVGDLPDVVHCETVEARSRLHDWEFAPHRHARLHQILLFEGGGGKAHLDGASHRLQPMDAVNVPMGCVHGFSFTPGTQGWVVTFAAEMVEQALEPSEGLRHVLARPSVGHAGPGLQEVMIQLFNEYAGRGFARAQILRAFSGVILGLVARDMSQREGVVTNIAEAGLFEQFEKLVDTHFVEHWSVADYARTLGVTPTHLSRVTRAAVGQGASRVIADRLIREARRNLVYTNLPVSTIAYALGFGDPAYFSRVFARSTGLSPREFRDRIELEMESGATG